MSNRLWGNDRVFIGFFVRTRWLDLESRVPVKSLSGTGISWPNVNKKLPFASTSTIRPAEWTARPVRSHYWKVTHFDVLNMRSLSASRDLRCPAWSVALDSWEDGWDWFLRMYEYGSRRNEWRYDEEIRTVCNFYYAIFFIRLKFIVFYWEVKRKEN